MPLAFAQAAFSVCAAAAWAQAAKGPDIYPPWLFEHSTFIHNLDELNSFVGGCADAGISCFVRWISSNGCECCRRQAPAWNQVVRAFAGNPQVAFGDIDTQDGGSDDAFTMRYFTNRTSAKGVQCPRSTRQLLCEEYSAREVVQYCVETISGQHLCQVDGGGTCSDAEASYLQKWKPKDGAAIVAELARLERILAAQGQTTKAAASLVTRLGILRQLAASLRGGEARDEL
mmetsp:Transcript_82200/g.238322  ORF Transcript_82200/g.238322 Transcript_82200/m.238322 type:complete len:230 (+) Transcript_82200:67-756(+)